MSYDLFLCVIYLKETLNIETNKITNNNTMRGKKKQIREQRPGNFTQTGRLKGGFLEGLACVLRSEGCLGNPGSVRLYSERALPLKKKDPGGVRRHFHDSARQ